MADHMTAEQLVDDFNGDTAHLIKCIKALLSLDAAGALVPHGIGGHARGLLSAAGARLSGMAAGWQPIETAPKYGSVIWAFNGEQARMKWVSGDNYALWIWDDCALSDIDPSPEQPTHWMPLPEPPHV